MIELSPRRASGHVRNIKIIGIGGAGANALDRLALDGVDPSSLVAANTDAQALVASVAGEKIQLGREVTRGLGSGGDPELGALAAEESAAEIRSALEGADAVFVLASLGGGTGSGAAPFIAELARESGALVLALVTLPFGFEGRRRAEQAREALLALQQRADAVVCFENDRMGDQVAPKAGVQAAFASADLILSQCVLGLAGVLNRQGVIRLGFDELAAVLQKVNARCLFGYGEAEGSNRPFDALSRAFKNPLMDKGRMLRDCETVLVQVSGGPDLTLDEVQLLMEEFNRHVNDSTRVLFGAAVDPDLQGRLCVTILSSIGDEREALPAAAPRPAALAKPAPKPSRPVEESRPAEPPKIVETVPAAAPEIVEPESLEPEPEPEEAETELPVEPVLEPRASEAAAEPEAPESAEPAAPPAYQIKPRGLRRASSQASLFGDDEPFVSPSKIAPPVPGRMLDRPYPKLPVREPEPEEPPVEPENRAPGIESEPVPEVESVPEIVESAAEELPVETAAQPEVPEEEETPEPEAAAEPEPEPAPKPVTARRPLLSPKPPEPQPAAPAVSRSPQQEVLQFEPVTRGRFEKSEPTIVDGQDLDVPTYMRRRIKLK